MLGRKLHECCALGHPQQVEKNDMSDSCLTERHLMKWCMLQEKCAVTFPQGMRIEEKCCLFLAFLSAPLQNLLTEIGIGYNFTLIFTLIKC